jgi:hypothetical protein
LGVRATNDRFWLMIYCQLSVYFHGNLALGRTLVLEQTVHRDRKGDEQHHWWRQACRNQEPTTIPRGGDQKYIEKRSESQWVRDEAWFQQQSQGDAAHTPRQCTGRYAKVQYRCCTSRLHELGTKGCGWLRFFRFNYNSTVLIQGDSLAEQHFLGMLWYAWSTTERVLICCVECRRSNAAQGRNHVASESGTA